MNSLFFHFREGCASGRVVTLKCTGKSFRSTEATGSKSVLPTPAPPLLPGVPSSWVPGGRSVGSPSGGGRVLLGGGDGPEWLLSSRLDLGTHVLSLQWLWGPDFLLPLPQGKAVTGCSLTQTPPLAGRGGRGGTGALQGWGLEESAALQHLC